MKIRDPNHLRRPRTPSPFGSNKFSSIPRGADEEWGLLRQGSGRASAI